MLEPNGLWTQSGRGCAGGVLSLLDYSFSFLQDRCLLMRILCASFSRNVCAPCHLLVLELLGRQGKECASASHRTKHVACSGSNAYVGVCLHSIQCACTCCACWDTANNVGWHSCACYLASLVNLMGIRRFCCAFKSVRLK